MLDVLARRHGHCHATLHISCSVCTPCVCIYACFTVVSYHVGIVLVLVSPVRHRAWAYRALVRKRRLRTPSPPSHPHSPVHGTVLVSQVLSARSRGMAAAAAAAAETAVALATGAAPSAPATDVRFRPSFSWSLRGTAGTTAAEDGSRRPK